MDTPAYCRLTEKEREEMSRGIAAGRSYAEIARGLGRPTSAMWREVGRNGGRGAYRAVIAARKAWKRAGNRKRNRRKLCANEPLWASVAIRLLAAWSPDEIAERLAVEYPLDTTMRVSPEAIYQYVYVLPRGSLKAALIKGLRQERQYRRKRRSGAIAETRGKIADMLSIEERPAEVADRTVPGHWEGDLILGRYKRSALGTLVERTTRTTILVPLKARDAASVRRAYARELAVLPRHLRRSLTYDQGKEMSEHRRLTRDTGTTVYFAHPGSPWERGTNENTNGLVRQFFPQGTDFSKVARHDIKHVQDLLNGRPRKSLGYQTPFEAFSELLR